MRHRIVLASHSPRRLALATEAGWHVTVAPPPEAAEGSAPARGGEESLEGYVQRLALAKATAVIAAGLTGTILACDTLSEVDGEALGKAADESEARQMLQRLSGRTHRVVTGVCLWWQPPPDGGIAGAALITASAESILAMSDLTPEFLDWYLASGLWQGKAGACGFQDERLPLRLVSGSPSNVVGLPLELISEMLEDLPPASA
ncbi:MAG: Maf family protein [Planctomycetota bacterium]|nr:Maf family protein [Planctomycetota bacterium]